ncbi:MAG: HDOD domain-containing protein, partial [Nitrospirota bacterium]|nr:HDOD domain-containing protein [Nitrospirota bacterium]
MEKIKKLPTLPVIAQEILALINDDLVTVNNLVKLIENDPAISSKILSVANSAFAGLAYPAKTLNNAVMRIGFDSIRNIALGISLMTVLGSRNRPDLLDYNRVFNHSVTVGLIARLISRRFSPDVPEEIFISGILHDAGLLVMNRYFASDYREVLKAFDKERTLFDTEKEVFGFTHADIGKWLADKWNLPATVSDTIMYHHNPSLAQSNERHVCIVHIADYLVSLCIIRPTEQDYRTVFDPVSL